MEVGQVGSASGACVCCGPRSEMTLSQVLYTYLSLFLTTLQGKFRLFPVYRRGNRSSEKVSHLPKATHHVSSLQLPELFHSKLVAFPLTTAPLLDSGLCSDVLRETYSDHSKIPTVTFFPYSALFFFLTSATIILIIC